MGKLQDSFKAYITSGATAVAADIAVGKTAYVGSGKIVGTNLGAAAIPYTLTNPGAESGLTGWTTATGSWRTTGPGHTGSNSFAGGPTGVESSQYQDVSAINGAITAAEIDAGNVWVTIGWWQNSFSGSDQATMRLYFLDGVAATIPYTKIFGFLEAVPNGTWWYRTIGAKVPPLTRTFRVMMVNQRTAGTNCDGYMDDITLEGVLIA